jgi:hypothetical protein
VVDRAFATRDPKRLTGLARACDAPLPWVPAAAARWLQEWPDPATGLGRLESLAVQAIRHGNETPMAIFKAAAALDSHPQYWGDSTLWEKINALADRKPPLVKIQGPAARLPQWGGEGLGSFRITSVPNPGIDQADAGAPTISPTLP